MRMKFSSSSDNEWMNKAKAEGISDDIIQEIEKIPLKNRLFFARVMQKEEIPLDHFAQQALATEERIERLKVGLIPKKIEDYKSLAELSVDMDRVEEDYKKRMGALEYQIFDPGDQMEIVRRFALPGFPAMTIYRYNNWDKQHHLLANSDRFCIGTMKNFNCKQMLEHYGGEAFIFVRDGKQWAVMAPHTKQPGSFTNISNNTLSPCEKAICIIAVYDLADKWKEDLARSISECKSEGFSEAYAYLSALPMAQEKEIKKDLMSKGIMSLHLTLLLEGQSGRVESSASNQQIIEEAKQLISEGKFDWVSALKPIVSGVSSENGARVAMNALKFAIDSVRRVASQAVRRAIHQGMDLRKYTDPSTQHNDDFLDEVFTPWQRLKKELESSALRKEIIFAASQAPYSDFIALLKTAASHDKFIMANFNIDTGLDVMTQDLEELMPYVIAHEKNQQNDATLSQVLKTSNPHAIHGAYERQVRGRTMHRQSPNAGLGWAGMEAYIIDMILSGEDLKQVRQMLVPYLRAVEQPEKRLSLMAQAILNHSPEKAKEMVRKLELAAGQSV